MDKREVDVAVIGAGTAGMVAYQRARRATDRIVLIEGDQYGTTCARVGCMPSKLLIAAAERAHQVRQAEAFGVLPGDVRIDGPAVMARVREERDRFVAPVVRSMESLPQEHRLMGHARFVDSHRLVVGDHTEVTAGRIVIATGSRPNIPGILKEAKDRLVVNDDVFDWRDLPSSVAVFGPGVIGVELGQALSRLGVKVRMFGVSGGIGGIQDEKVREYALDTFREEFAISPKADTRRVERIEEGVRISWSEGGKEHQQTFDYLLAATGRRPNIDHLDIQNAGIELDERGMPEFDPFTLRCGDSHIFIAGDVNNDRPLLHEAADEGRIAGDNAGAWPEVRTGRRKTPMAVVFTEPQIASVGLNIHQVDERCQGCFAVGEVSFEDQGRSKVIGKNRGLLRVYGEHGSGLFMGAQMFGPAAEHLAHLLAWCVQKRMTVSEMLEMPFYHPVIEEGLRTAIKDLSKKLRIGPAPGEGCMDCGPGV
ncbi:MULTISPECIES: dihydrolipoyl dehydrogenase [Marinobacter]|uniref:Putative Dihydrolipoyl dehydrogenase (Dihydrolipoamide dehydrogenase) (E3 component of pyruvate complex)belong to pyridine nucleotide-disulfide oxidoreductase, class I n=1 Tax=Marinobacter nauticus TaxID=2743 RepID=D9UAP3_MARNT|nr:MULTISPECIES: dihydrolipoyl dehydrogenase [Marinobacter]MCG8522263.1 dihydrolipoyl dehydrogenase [Pseudomonadales bacterium]ERS82670.1 dihydrolipoamide dehydrogenase [Marinobacter sp. EVN1]MBY5936809.1 dihydrolipoyl dehydrogenase [Marinobacter nauticus]MBY5954037.1 dihydrolipoyl dehydrogenase [Marinobacter nauticus]MBY6007830.1 dihydrolipoyl dehydrogenase [Marinobacter nauticus]